MILLCDQTRPLSRMAKVPRMEQVLRAIYTGSSLQFQFPLYYFLTDPDNRTYYMLKNIFNSSDVGLGEHNLENIPGDSYPVQMGKH